MLHVVALAPFVVLATRVVANPLLIRAAPAAFYSLSISKHINPDGKINPVQSDSIRINNLIKGNQLGSSTSNDTADEVSLQDIGPSYVVSIGVGTPPTNCKSCRFNVLSGMVFYMIPILDSLIVDTGSANTWVGANAPYVRTNTSVNISETVVSVMSYPDRWTSSNQKPMDQNVKYGSGSFQGKFDFAA
jgi:cathepsin E